MWERYFKYRSSSEFVQRWSNHLLPIGGPGPSCPIFYQFVTDVIIEEMIKRHFPVTTEQRECPATLDYEEHNAIQYTAGYVLLCSAKPFPPGNTCFPIVKVREKCLLKPLVYRVCSMTNVQWTHTLMLYIPSALGHLHDGRDAGKVFGNVYHW